jgi:hypothetical protein
VCIEFDSAHPDSGRDAAILDSNVSLHSRNNGETSNCYALPVSSRSPIFLPE